MSADVTVFQEYRWQKRLLLVFAPGRDRACFGRQHEMLRDARADLNERQTVVITVTHDTVAIWGRPQVDASAIKIRAAHDVGPQDFEVLLIGKDGGVKLRQREPLPVAHLIALIDSMPMRRREMR